MAPPRALPALLLAAGLVLASCGDDVDNATDQTTVDTDDDGGDSIESADATDAADDADDASTGTEAEAAVARLDEIDEAVARWEAAGDLEQALAAAEEARNLVTGPGVLGAGEAEVGFLPGAEGGVGLAQAFAGCELVERDVLGGSWDDPAGRWATLSDAIDAWTPDNNTFPTLPSHPQRIVGWASLTLDGATYDEAIEYAGHARLHVDVSREAIASCG